MHIKRSLEKNDPFLQQSNFTLVIFIVYTPKEFSYFFVTIGLFISMTWLIQFQNVTSQGQFQKVMVTMSPNMDEKNFSFDP
jgi:hypothetical protein